jgi:hypothetical protein
VTGRSSSTLSRSWERVRVMAAKPERGTMPLEYGLCRGYPCNPYLRGLLREGNIETSPIQATSLG